LQAHTPQEDYEHACLEAVHAMGQLLEWAFGAAAPTSLVCFGSRIQNTHLEGSDVDVAVVLAGQEAADSGEQRGALRKVEKVLRQWQTARSCRFSLKESRTFASIKVPILVLQYWATNGYCVELDVTAGREDTGANVPKGMTDSMIGEMLRDPFAADLARLVKIFAKLHRKNQAQSGHFNALSWVCLSIFVLQRMQMIPVWNNWNAVRHPPEGVQLAHAFLAVLDLVVELAVMVSKAGDSAQVKISIADGCITTVGTDAEGVVPNHTLIIEELGPAIHAGKLCNCARSVRRTELNLIADLCRRTAAGLRAGDISCLTPKETSDPPRIAPANKPKKAKKPPSKDVAKAVLHSAAQSAAGFRWGVGRFMPKGGHQAPRRW